jgi:hypothetical protein
LAALQKPLLESRLEAICERGCRQVWDVIATLERGDNVPETEDLDAAERAWLLAELNAVMTVYAERCRVD